MTKPKIPDLSPEVISELLSYDRDTGKLYWKVREKKWFHPRHNYKTQKIWNKRYAGKQAINCKRRGYLVGGILGYTMPAHRLAWVIGYGFWNFTDIDHIDGNPENNKLENLRMVSHQENTKNQKLRSTNNTGVLGVDFRKETGKYRARIMVDGKTINLGEYDQLERAARVRLEAEKLYGFHPNHGRL